MHARLPAALKLPRQRKLVRYEDPIHRSILNYLESTLPDEFVVHHSRNGGRSKGENGRAKGLGTKKGFPDLLILGSDDFGGLVRLDVPTGWLMEVKVPGKGPDSDQRKLHKKLKALGFKVGVVRSIDDARQLVIEWGLPSTDFLVRQARNKGSGGLAASEAL